MNKLEELGTLFTTDVLVVGGGMAGLPAALRAQEEGASVIIAEKGHTGLAGQAPRGGNGILAMPKDGDYEAYMQFVCNIGDYLNDQDALETYAYKINPTLHKLAEWGAELSTEKNGDIAIFEFPGSPMYNTGINLYALDNLRKTAEKRGIRLLNHTNITGLVKIDGKVWGAVGFDIYDGTFYIIKAKTVVVACGANAYRATRMFTNNGEGNILAFDAGAQMRSAEFNFIEVGAASTGETIHNSCHYLFNQLGENVWNKYVHWNASDVCPELIAGIEKEIREGRGPVYVDLDIMENDPDWISQARGLLSDKGGPKKLFPDKLSWMARLEKREAEYIDFGRKPAITFAIHGNSGFVRVDPGMHTTVKGLYQAGADTGLGSAIHGAAPLPAGQRGGSFMYCAITGDIAGTNAALEANEISDYPEFPYEQIAALKEKAYRGYHENMEDGISPRQMFDRIQDAVCGIDVIFKKSEESLNEALDTINQLKADLAHMTANDYHELKLCHEAESFVRCSEIVLKSGLARKESRNFHFRIEYPEKDNQNWMKWVLADNVDGEVVISTEEVPIQNYRFQPPQA